MENTRPKLTDPADFANIKKWYFKDDRPVKDLDPVEELERMEAKQRNNNKSSR